MALDPLVSIIMPTYNQAEWLPAALDGLAAQTITDYELIVVDDASTDETPQILEERLGAFKTTYRHAENKGSAEAINTGTRVARGMFWAWVSSDNVMADDWLEDLLAAITYHGAGAAYGGCIRVQPNGKQTYRYTPHTPEGLISGEACYYGPAFLIRADVWKEAGEHRGGTAHDYDHWARVEEVCDGLGLPIVGVDKSLCIYNAHDKRQAVTKRSDAKKWRKEALKRRGVTA